MRPQIAYRDGYKYQLRANYSIPTDILVKSDIDIDYVSLTKSGLLTVKYGYAWDGPSDPAIDTPNFMRGSLGHDALYQLMRDGYLDPSNREKADKLLYQCVREDGMTWVRAQWVYWAVRWFGGPAADPVHKHRDIIAP